MSTFAAGNTLSTGIIITSDTTGNIALSAINGLIDASSTSGALVVPQGTTTQRPGNTANGQLRFNSTLGSFEGYSAGAWGSIGGSGGSGGTSWQPVQNTNFIAVSGNGYGVNTATGNVTVTLPANPTAGQQINLFDYGQTFSANGVIIYSNGNKILGNTANITIQSSGASVGLVYYDTIKGWIPYNGFSSSIIGPYTLNYLIVAGGGGGSGGNYHGGGGGAGGMLSGLNLSVIPGTGYSVVVGAGGAGGPSASGSSGSNSSLYTLTAALGGGGGGSHIGPFAGGSGGSGGGGTGGSNTGAIGPAGAGTAGQGNPGGSGSSSTAPAYGAGGGGGAGATGANGTGSAGGAGGAGLPSSITGSSTYYAGGGGGSAYNSTGPAGAGGTGGGGAGGTPGAGAAGGTNTGGGGGGGERGSPTTGSGGSGVVIVSYLGGQRGSGGTVTTSGGQTIHTFNSSGTFTA